MEIEKIYRVDVEWLGTYSRPFETKEEAEQHFSEVAKYKHLGAFAAIYEGIENPKTKLTRYFLLNTTDISKTRF